MKSSKFIPAVFALLLVSAAGFSSPARAGVAGWMCDQAAQAGLNKILEAYGVNPDVSEVGYDTVAEYLKNPDQTRLTAALNALGQGTAGLVFPEYGFALKAGKVMVGGVEYTIEEAREQQLDAFLCGGFSYGNELTRVDFFSLNAVQQQIKGLNCRNFSERVKTLEQMSALKSVWDGYYYRQLREMSGEKYRKKSPDDDETDTVQYKMYKAWSTLEQKWRIERGAALYRKLGEDLVREADKLAKAPAATQCKRGPMPASFAEPRTDKGNFVDRCYAFASGCDDNNSEDPAKKPAANEFCRRKGYQRAVASHWSYKGPTEILSSGQICPDPKGCGGLDFVSCE